VRSTQHPTTGISSQPQDITPRPEQRNVLIVEDDQHVRMSIGLAIESANRRIHHAGDLAEARKILKHNDIDLVLIDVALPDGDGYELARELRDADTTTRCIVITGHATLERAVDAMRSGAVDFISKPLNIDELNERVAEAIRQQRADHRKQHQFDRLRKLCKKLNKARHEITDQVDILCNDLVTAYQELAEQVNEPSAEMLPPLEDHAPLAELQQDELPNAELRTALGNELDLEQVLRRTMEHLLDQAGPANVMVFLPSSSGGFTVGGYVNYTYERDELPVVMQQLADEAAAKLMNETGVIELRSDEQIADFIDFGHAWLTDMNVIAVPCIDEAGEPLAGIMLFRSRDEPMGKSTVALLEQTAPVLAEQLVRVIRVHHRTQDLFEDEGGMAA
jgi:DNA-binding response OmpR family regulator